LYIQVEFEWDERKNRSNIAKHGISFETAKLVFDDPYLVSFPERIVDGELRWHSIGSTGGIVILTVAHTIQEASGNEMVRIISARKASRTERREYGDY
jgi:uncharacterized DUF497 family protein